MVSHRQQDHTCAEMIMHCNKRSIYIRKCATTFHDNTQCMYVQIFLYNYTTHTESFIWVAYSIFIYVTKPFFLVFTLNWCLYLWYRPHCLLDDYTISIRNTYYNITSMTKNIGSSTNLMYHSFHCTSVATLPFSDQTVIRFLIGKQ